MRLNHTAHIELLLSPTQSIAQLQKKITAIGAKEGAVVRVAPVMEAQLTGLHFNIEANTPERQSVSSDVPTEWTWDVEPTKTGNQDLHLTLTAVLTVGGRERLRTIRVFDKVLPVKVTLYDRISGFVSDNWKWLWTAILVPVGLWAVRRHQARRSSAGPTAAAARAEPGPSPPPRLDRQNEGGGQDENNLAEEERPE